MHLTIMQTVRLADGQKVKVVGFDRDATTGEKLVDVGWTNEFGEYWHRNVKPEEILIDEKRMIV